MNYASIAVFGLGCAIAGAAVTFFINMLSKNYENKSIELSTITITKTTQDNRVNRIMTEIDNFKEFHTNWRSPKATRIAVETLIERIRSC